MIILFIFILCFAAWTALTWQPMRGDIILGVASSAVVAVLSSRVFVVNPKKSFSPKSVLWFGLFVFMFLYRFAAGALDAALRVIDPRSPKDGGIVKIRTRLKNDAMLPVLANAISLSPGTLSIDMAGPDIFVHWLGVRLKDQRKASDIILGKLEAALKEASE